MSDFMNRAQVAAWLKVTPQKFAELRAGELKDKGFPKPAFGTRAAERWDPEILKAWRLSQIPAELRALLAEHRTGDDEPSDAAELDRRAVAMARGELH